MHSPFLKLVAVALAAASSVNAITVLMIPNLTATCGDRYAYVGCTNMSPNQCCTPPAGMAATMVENQENYPCLGINIYNMPNCPLGTASTTKRVYPHLCYLINFPIHSVKPFICDVARRGLVERSADGETTPEQCLSPNIVAFIDDDDGMEVVAEIPEGKVEEYVRYAETNDVKQLKKLKVKERRERKNGKSSRTVSA